MMLDLGRQRDFVQGAQSVEFVGGVWRFRRMNPELHRIFSESESPLIRALSTTGIRLAFAAAPKRIVIDLEYGKACRQFFKPELVVDGGEPTAFGPDAAAPGWSGAIFERAAAEPHRFEIFLPYSVETGVRRLELEGADAARPLPRLQGGRWLVIGDSVSQGMTATRPTRTWSTIAARELGMEELNVAVGGTKYDARVGPAAGQIPARLATVSLGANDSFQHVDPAYVESQARGVLDGLRAAQPRLAIAVITPIHCFETDGTPATGQLDPYRAAARRAAAGRERVWVIEGPDVFPEDFGLFIDGVHPNEAGMAAYARGLVPALRRVLAEDAA
jgi:lysophospholipase L1-like esterase